MNEIKIRFANFSDLDGVIVLSKAFEKEDCCNGILANTKEDLKGKAVAVAKSAESIIGYALGTFEVKEKDTSKFKKGEKSFCLEEIYIDKNFRQNGVGEKLLAFMETCAKREGCTLFETTAVSKDYKRLLSFYIEKSGMDFWYAQLIKKI